MLEACCLPEGAVQVAEQPWRRMWGTCGASAEALAITGADSMCKECWANSWRHTKRHERAQALCSKLEGCFAPVYFL